MSRWRTRTVQVWAQDEAQAIGKARTEMQRKGGGWYVPVPTEVKPARFTKGMWTVKARRAGR